MEAQSAMMTSRSDRQQWVRFFERAIQGASGLIEMDAAQTVDFATQVADEAMKELEKRFPPESPPPLFEPLLKEQAAKQAQDDSDSSFRIGR